MCTDAKDYEKLTKMYGSLVFGKVYDKDSGGFKKNHVVWNRERICNVSSTWPVCGKGRAEAFFYTQALKSREGRCKFLQF